MSSYPFSISSPYGPRRRGDGWHDGIDFDTPDQGAPLGAARNGVWRHAWNDAYGRMGWLQADDGNWYLYAHLARHYVADGARVGRGQRVALSGGRKGQDGAGNSTGSHVHYEVRIGGRNGRSTNPDPNYIGGLWVPVLGEEQLMVTAEDEAKIRAIMRDEAQKVGRAILYGLFSGTEVKELPLGPDFDWRLKNNLQKILAKP